VHKNQSWHVISVLFAILSFAIPQDPAVGTITSSPGRQSAGRATPSLSAVCKSNQYTIEFFEVAPKLKG
jgi:hypothetical protein